LAAAAAQGAHEDDTRATGRGPAAKAAPKKRSGTEYFARAIAVLAMAAILYGAWSAVSSYLLYKHGAELTRQIQTEELTDLDQIWTKWSELSQGNSSSLALRGTRKAVKQKFVEAADRVIGAFRNSDTQPVYERDWERARSELARALAVEPDNTVRGELRLTEGHIARINGSTHKNAAELESAVEKFNEAARLLPQSPDPELGLARVYIYGLRDVDKANDALHEAEKRGYRLSNRDRLQLADGYLARADRLWWDTRNVRGLPQEKDQIQRAEADYNQALETYQSIAPYGNSTAQITRVQSSLESVRSRLDQIENGGDDSIGGVVKPLANKIEDAIRAITGERKKDGGHP
jgi:tetratricopeptide (TPR) repeat protein